MMRRQQMERIMLAGEIVFLGMVIAAFTLFGITLAYASAKSARLRH